MAYLLLVLTVLFWAGNFVLARSLVDILPPVTMASMRWTIAFLILLPFVYKRLYQNRLEIIKHWKILTLLGVLGVGCFNTFVYLGVQSTTAINATLLQSAIPIMILVISSLFFQEKVSAKQCLGIAFSCLGVIVLVTKGQVQNLVTMTLNTGDLWILASVTSWTLYSVFLRYKPQSIDGLTFLAITMLLANIVLYPLVSIEWYFLLQSKIEVPSISINTDTVTAILYLAVFPSLLSYLFWNRGVAEIGASKASLFIYLLPVFGLILSVIFLAEQPQTFHGIGILLVFIGIYLAIITELLAKLNKSSK